MKKALCNLLGNTMREELYGINSWLRVSTSIKSVLHAADKELSMCAKHTKGHKDFLREWIDTYHP